MKRLGLQLALLNVVGGLAVLGSYAYGFAARPDLGDVIWGGVPEQLKPVYFVCMILAAVGYFPFTTYVLFRLDADETRIGRFSYRLWLGLYTLILIPSALWMPLTVEWLARPSTGLWWLIRLDLALVGVASLALLIALVLARPAGPAGHRRLAILGAILFSWQTAILDGLVWPAYFPL